MIKTLKKGVLPPNQIPIIYKGTCYNCTTIVTCDANDFKRSPGRIDCPTTGCYRPINMYCFNADKVKEVYESQ